MKITVLVDGVRRASLGGIAMDQFVVDLSQPSDSGPDRPRILPPAQRAEVTLFGDGSSGEMTADEWADAIGTIGYEVITRISARVPRRYINASNLSHL